MCYELFKHVVMIILINVVVFEMMYSLYDWIIFCGDLDFPLSLIVTNSYVMFLNMYCDFLLENGPS